MSLWNKIKSARETNAERFVYSRIPRERTDETFVDAPLVADRSYFRIFLREMYLTESRRWFTDWHPAVSTSVRLLFAGNAVTVSRVSGASKEGLGRGVQVNYPVTDLTPFRGGVVEIESALLALKGASYLGAAIGVLQGFSGLICAPLGQALAVADKVAAGMQDLFAATDGQVHLCLHDAFTSAGDAPPGQVTGNVLRPGYLAVVLANEKALAPERLSVRGQRLYYAPPDGAPASLEGHDFMLFFIEGRQERDDWRLRSIEEPLEKAKEALLGGDDEKAESYRRVALMAAFASPDLAVHDRRRVAQAIKAELAELADAGHGAVPAGPRDMNALMERAPRVEEAMALGELSLAELMEP
jgi:hypothetical protein